VAKRRYRLKNLIYYQRNLMIQLLKEYGEYKMMIIKNEKITAKEYIEFLKRSNLGSQYPKERFEERIEKLVKNTSISLVARNENQQIIGVLFGITDFSYWLFITDLGVDINYERQGIGSKLIKEAHEIAGGIKDIAIYLCVNDDAIPFYEKLGMKKSEDVMEFNHIEWTRFNVGDAF
jgi:predicted N-acetyltransferase YhbS